MSLSKMEINDETLFKKKDLQGQMQSQAAKILAELQEVTAVAELHGIFNISYLPYQFPVNFRLKKIFYLTAVKEMKKVVLKASVIYRENCWGSSC